MASGWFWPSVPVGASAPAIAIVPFSFQVAPSGIAVPGVFSPTLWPFFQTVTAGAALSSAGSGLGIVAAVTSGIPSSGMFALNWDGTLHALQASSSSGTVSDTPVSLPNGVMYGGLSRSAAGVYALTTSSGVVYNNVSTQIGTFNTSAFGLVSGSSLYYSFLSSLNSIGTMTAGGVTGVIALPAAITSVNALLAASGQPLVVGGQTNAPLLAGANAYAVDPATSVQVLGVGSGQAVLWTQQPLVGTDAWAQTNIVTGGVANLTSLAWVPNGTQALATDAVSGVVQVLQYVTNVLSLQQTIALAGAGSVATLSSNTDALVCTTATNKIWPLTATAGSWSVSGTSLSLTGPGAIVATGPGAASAGYASGVATLVQAGGLWSISAVGRSGTGTRPRRDGAGSSRRPSPRATCLST